MTAVLVFFLLFMYIFIGTPIVFSLGLASFGFLILVLNDIPLTIIVQNLYNGANSFTLLAVPLFIFTGSLMNLTNISKHIFDFAASLVGHLKGGLSAINIVTSMLFAGVSGTSVADTAAVGAVVIPAMKQRGYKADFAAAVTASSSTIGIIIPPSVPMILYAVAEGISVTKLFIAGILPGILIGLALLVVSTIISIKENYGSEDTFSIKKVFVSFFVAIPALLLPVIILGGILGGIFTPTEAAAVAVFYVLFLGTITRQLNIHKIYTAAKETVIFSGSVLMIIASAKIVAWVFARAAIPQTLVEPFLSITKSPVLFLWIVSGILIVAGTFLHGTAMLVILVPLFIPLMESFHIPHLQFAMTVIICWGIGQQTPPVGSALFITCSLAKVDVWELTKANLPFICAMIAILAAVIHMPFLSVWLPNLILQ